MAWLERTLRDYHGTVVAITHDRYFLDNVARWILELERGKGHPFEGNYSSWLDQKRARLEAEEKSDSTRRRTLERELEWVRMAPKARQAKGKARLAAYDKLQAEAEAAERGPDKLQIQLPAGRRLGGVVIEADDVDKGYGDRLLIDDLTFKLPPAGIVGVIGPNGAGKTTLFRMITGQEQPDAGTFRVGDTVDLAYVDQSRDVLDGEKSVYEEITGSATDFMKLGDKEVNGRAYVSSFNFKGSDQQKKVGVLSGGERNRVLLAKMLKEGVERDPPRRAHQRPRRRHAPRPRGRPRGVRRLRGGDQPRPLVPRPHRHPHPRLRGRQPGALVRGQLQRVRGVEEEGAGRRPAPPHQVQAPDPLAGSGATQRQHLGAAMAAGSPSSGRSTSSGSLRRLVGVVDAGEARELAGSGLGVEALGVALLAQLDRRVDEHLDERQAGRRVERRGRRRGRPGTG